LTGRTPRATWNSADIAQVKEDFPGVDNVDAREGALLQQFVIAEHAKAKKPVEIVVGDAHNGGGTAVGYIARTDRREAWSRGAKVW
jgi:hypothetical protein